MSAARFLTAPLLVALCGGLLLCRAPQVRAQQAIHRCTSASGTTVFTDRRCEDLGATSRVIRPRVDAAGRATPANLGCPRRLSDLVQQISAAIDQGDANRLASLYPWNGVSDATANRLLDRMEGIVRRPLVDIAPIFPPPAPLTAADGSVVDDNADGYYPQAAPVQKQRPVGLRLQQTLSNGTPSSTVLGLRRRDDCFWITL